MPLRRDLGCIVVVLREVNPSVTARYFVVGVQVLVVFVTELINPNQSSGLRVTDVLHLMPPLLDSYPTNIPHVSYDGDHRRCRRKVVFDYVWTFLLYLLSRKRKKYIQRKYRTFVGNKANHPATSIKVTYAEHNVATSGILTTHCNLRALATK